MENLETTETESTMTEDPAIEPEQTEPETEQLESSDDRQVAKLRKESARYRTQLRETQSQLEQTTAQLTAARRQILANHRAVTGWVRDDAVSALLDGLDVPSLFGDDGTLDADALGNAVREQLKAHPYFDRKPGIGAMKTVLANHSPHVRQPVNSDPLAAALRVRR
ncbi:hypothetical protein [Bifidobacterium moukalabense]|uniref:hypothetical protein n=1 Tax=Bifidobacterium moukalabense TaxID=1333651 RepID=UPI0010F917CD|nr:hypothetical protein [Bifidobacterium moukalabense]